MILKIVKEKTLDEVIQGTKEIITDYYEGKNFKVQNNYIITDKDTIDIDLGEYFIYDDMLGCNFKYKVLEVYLMNNEGKTIEKIR